MDEVRKPNISGRIRLIKKSNDLIRNQNSDLTVAKL
jgi:hypothetical protein